MHILSSQQDLDIFLVEHPAALLLYGGQSCGVCQSLKPRLTQLLAEHFPQMQAAYIDCQADGATLCAQQRVMTVPVVQIWFQEQRFAEFFKVFALSDIQTAIARPYGLMFDSL
ncbi:MAG TPA: thioredoxin family protein [Thiopseudomonas sp.]|nr:thioredoxin family protein [Thiopseudomonas sp.]